MLVTRWRGGRIIILFHFFHVNIFFYLSLNFVKSWKSDGDVVPMVDNSKMEEGISVAYLSVSVFRRDGNWSKDWSNDGHHG